MRYVGERYDDSSIELEIFLRNWESVGIIEVKGEMKPNHIEDLTRDKVEAFKTTSMKVIRKYTLG